MLILSVVLTAAADPLPLGEEGSSLTYGRMQDGWCSVCGTGPLPPVTAAASSVLTEAQRSYPASSVLDGVHSSAWCEGVPGDGVGEWIELRFPHPIHPGGLLIHGGYTMDTARLEGNGRLKKVRVDIDGQPPFALLLDDPAVPVPASPGGVPEGSWIAAVQANPAIAWRFSDALTQRVRLTILEVYPGEKHQDTCISELHVDLVDPAWDQ